MLFNIIPSNSMEQSHSWEANSYWCSYEILRILWKPKVRDLLKGCHPRCFMQNMEMQLRQNTTKCNIFIMLVTTCFGQCWPSSGHEKYIWGKNYTVRYDLETTIISHGAVHTCRTLICHLRRVDLKMANIVVFWRNYISIVRDLSHYSPPSVPVLSKN
jgi:hypothetical protein